MENIQKETETVTKKVIYYYFQKFRDSGKEPDNSQQQCLEPTYSNHFKGLMHHLGNMARHHHRTTQEICTVNSDFTNLLKIFTPLENSLSKQ